MQFRINSHNLILSFKECVSCPPAWAVEINCDWLVFASLWTRFSLHRLNLWLMDCFSASFNTICTYITLINIQSTKCDAEPLKVCSMLGGGQENRNVWINSVISYSSTMSDITHSSNSVPSLLTHLLLIKHLSLFIFTGIKNYMLQ